MSLLYTGLIDASIEHTSAVSSTACLKAFPKLNTRYRNLYWS